MTEEVQKWLTKFLDDSEQKPLAFLIAHDHWLCRPAVAYNGFYWSANPVETNLVMTLPKEIYEKMRCKENARWKNKEYPNEVSAWADLAYGLAAYIKEKNL